MLPLIEIGLTDLPKRGWGGAFSPPPRPPAFDRPATIALADAVALVSPYFWWIYHKVCALPGLSINLTGVLNKRTYTLIIFEKKSCPHVTLQKYFFHMQAGNERGLCSLQHSLWPDIHSIHLAI